MTSDTPDHYQKLKLLEKKAEGIEGTEGLFQHGCGMSLSEAAYKTWEAGYIAVPSVAALLEAIEKNLDAKEEATVQNRQPNTSSNPDRE